MCERLKSRAFPLRNAEVRAQTPSDHVGLPTFIDFSRTTQSKKVRAKIQDFCPYFAFFLVLRNALFGVSCTLTLGPSSHKPLSHTHMGPFSHTGSARPHTRISAFPLGLRVLTDTGIPLGPRQHTTPFIHLTHKVRSSFPFVDLSHTQRTLRRVSGWACTSLGDRGAFLLRSAFLLCLKGRELMVIAHVPHFHGRRCVFSGGKISFAAESTILAPVAGTQNPLAAWHLCCIRPLATGMCWFSAVQSRASGTSVCPPPLHFGLRDMERFGSHPWS